MESCKAEGLSQRTCQLHMENLRTTYRILMKLNLAEAPDALTRQHLQKVILHMLENKNNAQQAISVYSLRLSGVGQTYLRRQPVDIPGGSTSVARTPVVGWMCTISALPTVTGS